ncbi:hypothetical protein CAL29_05870 [Bordetella genomosp. 10]|uniref:Uncharacterized protein n=1 Tax=Bordetella genomosp. 10 TaxID=1416804 RepID=A0A261SKG1_9BORD|nr:hypothetical protein [Bordetella genomosp. 10]OZI37894.1 hypothetical protein CAL29_05870 [Bordetella genomosp. 10]
MLWRFSANHTHLYPGARLRCLDTPDDTRLSADDDMLVEFSDGVLATGCLLEAHKDFAVLRMPAYRTQHGTDVAARAWRLAPAGEPGHIRVQKRLPAD